MIHKLVREVVKGFNELKHFAVDLICQQKTMKQDSQTCSSDSIIINIKTIVQSFKI